MKIELLHITENAEKLIEIAGRTAYQSQARITEDSAAKFIKMLINHNHTSVLEHATATFKISGVSRAFSHQLVRHRIASYTQKSQRYCEHNKGIKKTPWSIFTNEEENDILYLYNGGRTTNELSKIYNVSQQTITNIIIRNHGIIRELGNYCISNDNVNMFIPSKITNIEAQLLGLIFADGCIFHDKTSNNYRIIIKMKDESYVRQISYIFGCNLISTSDNLFSSTICSKTIYDTLTNIYGLTPNKSLTLSPKLLKQNLPKKMISHFIRGFLEGDGSILWYPDYNKRMIVFTCASLEFINWINETLHNECSSEYKTKIKTINSGFGSKNKCYQLVYQNKDDINKILNYIYNDFNLELCLHRKLLVAATQLDLTKNIINAADDFANKYEIVIPPSIISNLEALCIFTIPIQMGIQFYRNFDKILPREDLRFCLTESERTEIVITTNFREWRHIIGLRTDTAAQWEIRNVCIEILKILKEKAPLCFGDL